MNIKDIARIAGVSVSTVSFVLNNKPGVSEDTRFRVLSVAEKFNYVPNHIARSLVTKKTKSIGLIIPDIAEVFYGKLARIIQDAVDKKNYSLVLCNSENKAYKEAKYLDFLVEKVVDGIIMVPVDSSNADKVNSLEIPVVFVDRYMEGVAVSYVGIDNEIAAYRANEHLLKLGHKKISCITGPDGASSSEERIRGYSKALAHFNIEFDPFWLKKTDWTVEGGYDAASKLLQLKNTPTAIFVTGDTCAIGVFEALHIRGLKVPQDIAVVGFDDMKFSPFLRVPLTTVKQPLDQMGNRSVDILFGKIDSKYHYKPQRVILDTEFIIRESCGFNMQSKKRGFKVN
ncbi:MAG: LacI family DNA-binding transcriptional regulator [Spirochaetota bacterium]